MKEVYETSHAGEIVKVCAEFQEKCRLDESQGKFRDILLPPQFSK